MSYDFIAVHKLGVGQILVRHSEIVLMEPTHQEFTRLDFTFGDHIIVEEGPMDILQLIKTAEQLAEAEAAVQQNGSSSSSNGSSTSASATGNNGQRK